MKHILIIILALGLSACNEQAAEQNKAMAVPQQRGDISPVADDPAIDPPPVVEPAPVLPKNYLNVQVYSAVDFKTQTPLPWCTDGLCESEAMPNPCADTVLFNDFTIFNPNVGTFFGSIPENITIDEETRVITLISNVTGHQGLSFSYQFLNDMNEWEVTYSPNCGRIYQFALGTTTL